VASASGFQSVTQNVTVSGGAATSANFTLSPATGTITGKVTNISNGTVIPAATVSWSGGSGSTNGSGVYTLEQCRRDPEHYGKRDRLFTANECSRCFWWNYNDFSYPTSHGRKNHSEGHGSQWSCGKRCQRHDSRRSYCHHGHRQHQQFRSVHDKLDSRGKLHGHSGQDRARNPNQDHQYRQWRNRHRNLYRL